MVAAAIVDDLQRPTRVLAARRTAPPELAGQWEFPGGKVEPGERPAEALVREVAEELGCAIGVTDWLPGSSPISTVIGPTLSLTVATAVLLDGSPEPDPVEHDAVRWLAADELEVVDWLEPDRPFLPPLAALLASTPAKKSFLPM